MNVSELARQLRIRPQEMLEILPQYGFDIGARAVKVDDKVAERIIREWRNIKRIMEEKADTSTTEEKNERRISKIKRMVSMLRATSADLASEDFLPDYLAKQIDALILKLEDQLRS